MSNNFVDTSYINYDWNQHLYQRINECTIKNIIIFGFKQSENHTHYYIHKMYYDFFIFYYPDINVYWFDFCDPFPNNLLEHSVIFYSPAHSTRYKNKIPISDKLFYIIHLDYFDNMTYNTLSSFINDPSNVPIINGKKYIYIYCREKITNLTFFEKNITDNSICMPWFANTLYTVPSNVTSIYNKNKNSKYLCFIGSIWKLTITLIKELIHICIKHNIYLLLKGRIFGISNTDKKYILNVNNKYIIYVPFNYKVTPGNDTNSIEFIDNTYGIKGLLPLQGDIHDNNYISNRIFETIANGYVVITNNSLTKKYFTTVIYNENLEELILKYMELLENESEYVKILQLQIDEYIHKFYGYNNINSLLYFLKETAFVQNTHVVLGQNSHKYKNCKIMFTSDLEHTHAYFSNVCTNDHIVHIIKSPSNYIIHLDDSVDIFLIDRLISMECFCIYICHKCLLQNYIIKVCNKYNKIYKITNYEQFSISTLINNVQQNQVKSLTISNIL